MMMTAYPAPVMGQIPMMPVVQAPAELSGRNAPDEGSSQLPKPEGKHVFDFKNCRFSVKAKTGKKELLKGISATVRSGEVLAVMGPSGAGKTTLLNLLTLVKSNGEASGDVTLNGHVLTPSMFSKYCAVVTQVDQHWAFLTCREALEYAADLYMQGTKEEKKARVDDLLNQMGLMTCADTKCGNQFLQGLSGGQKRRLSLALALMKDPLLLFLDEPTSGLDAAAAASIMSFMKDLARRLDIIIVCTIHQPSSKVFEGFDGTMVLSGGKVAYCGPASRVSQYLASIGKPIPANTNPAEYLLDLVNAEFTDPAEVEAVISQWESKETLKAAPASSRLPEKQAYGSNFAGQVWNLLRRHSTLIVRDPTLYLGRMVMFCFVCIFFSIIYIEARDRVQEQVLYRMFLSMWSIGVPSSLGVVAVYAFNTEFFAIKKEVKDGMFSPLAYLTSNLILQIPLMLVLSVSAIGIGNYAISNFYGPNFGEMMVLVAAALWSFECMAQALSVQYANPLLGMLSFMNMWFASFLFAGVMVPEDDVIWPFRLFAYILPMRWTLSSMMTIEFKDTTFSGASLDESAALGYVCDEGIPEIACYGHTGEQVLESIGRNYKSIGPEDHVARDIGIILAIGAAWKLIFCFMLWRKTTAMQQPKPSADTSTSSRSLAVRVQVNGNHFGGAGSVVVSDQGLAYPTPAEAAGVSHV